MRSIFRIVLLAGVFSLGSVVFAGSALVQVIKQGSSSKAALDVSGVATSGGAASPLF